MKTRSDLLKEVYHLEKHVEGGSFSEVFTSETEKDGRALAGSICFLLTGEETSCFHQIDCEEIWYYHEGCGIVITVITGSGETEKLLLGKNTELGERAVVSVPKGAIFAAENIDKTGYTFVSCVTVPKFLQEGSRLVGRTELEDEHPGITKGLERLFKED